MNKYTASFSLLIILCLALNTYGQENLIYNGSFENGPNVGSYITLYPGDGIPGWQVLDDPIDYSRTYGHAAEGERWIDLNGSPGIGAIQQSFFTEVGKNYLVSFYLSGNPTGGPEIKKLKVSAGNHYEIFDFSILGKSSNNMGWTKQTFIFTAIDRKSYLKFESLKDYYPGNYGPAIDDVSAKKTNRGPTGISIDSEAIEENHVNNDQDNRYVSAGSSKSLLKLNYGILGGSSYYIISSSAPTLIKSQFNYSLNIQEAKPGVHFGLFGEILLPHIFLRSELRFNSNRIEYSYHNSFERYQALDLPVNIGIILNSFKICMGPAFVLYLGKQSNLDEVIDVENNIDRLSLAMEASLSYSLGIFSLDLKYHSNLNEFYSDPASNSFSQNFSKFPRRFILNMSIRLSDVFE